MKHACRAFDARHPELSDAFFDESFLQHHFSPLLAEFLNRRGELPDATDLAQAWAATYGRTAAEEAAIASAAVDFLTELSRQLAAQSRLQEFLDRAAWDRTARHLREIEEHTAQLSNEARRREIEDNFDRLFGAALRYQRTSELLLEDPGSDGADLILAAREAHASARRRLERFDYVAAASVLADFDELILAPYDAVLEVLSTDPVEAAQHHLRLREGVEQLDARLAAAP